MRVPVLLFTGFLESGKTKFIQETLEDKRFLDKERTLLIVCEEGVEEYIPEKFSGENVFIEIIEEEADLKQNLLKSLVDKTKAERVIIEYNGMWMLDSLYAAFPDNWGVVQEMMFAESKTFLNFNRNMRNLMVDKLKSAEVLVFNRADDTIDKMEFHKIVRAVNPRTNMAYEFSDGRVEYDEIEDPLPYDIDAPIIEISDEHYAVWYRDMNENIENYVGKEILFKAMIGFNKDLPKNTFMAGRHVMTCCEDDIEFLPVLCKGKVSSKIENGQWVMVTGMFSNEYNKVYGCKGPIIKDARVKVTDKPEKAVAEFY